MKVTTNCYLNKRIGTPDTNAPIAGYLNPETGLDIIEILAGQSIEGNSIWYKANDGYLYWSGGFIEVEIAFETDNYSWINLTPDLCFTVLKQALIHFEQSLRNKIGDNFAGCCAGYKYQNNTRLPFICFVVFVQKKITNPSYLISNALQYLGFIIPVDVQERESPLSHGQPGSRIKRIKEWMYGAVAFKLSDNVFSYLLTCYHVLGNDLLKNGIYHFETSSQMNDPEVVEIGNEDPVLGICSKGKFSSELDTVLVALDNDDYFSNRGYSTFTTSIDHSLIGKEIFAIKDGHRITGKVNNINTSIDIFYPTLKSKVNKTGLLELSNLRLEEGDSGSPIMIRIGQVTYFLGMHIGGNPLYSYAIPADIILRQFKLKL